MITTNDICEMTGVAPSTLTEWVTAGVITPVVAGGPGRGNSRRFTSMSAVGIAVAVALAKSERGCAPAYVGAVVEAFAAVTGAWLREKFAKGDTHFFAIHQGKPLLTDPRPYELVNVEAIYEQFHAKAVVA